jgi:uncharacterized membrane protein YtjA (UPF0391 family)
LSPSYQDREAYKAPSAGFTGLIGRPGPAPPLGQKPDLVPPPVRIFTGPPPGTIVPEQELFRQIGVRRSGRSRNSKPEVYVMLGWVVTFLVVALVAGILGFGGVAGASIEIAKIIFFIAVVLFVVSAVVGVARGRRI